MESGIAKEIAAERMSILYKLAVKRAAGDPELAKNYVKTLRRIGAHYKVRMPGGMKAMICADCNMVLIPGLTASVRLASSKGYAVYTCNSCKREQHIFYKGR